MAIGTRLEILKESVDTVVRRSRHCDPLIDNLIMQGMQAVVGEYKLSNIDENTFLKLENDLKNAHHFFSKNCTCSCYRR